LQRFRDDTASCVFGFSFKFGHSGFTPTQNNAFYFDGVFLTLELKSVIGAVVRFHSGICFLTQCFLQFDFYIVWSLVRDKQYMPITEEFFNWLTNLELETLWTLLLWLPLIVRAKTFGFDLD